MSGLQRVQCKIFSKCLQYAISIVKFNLLKSSFTKCQPGYEMFPFSIYPTGGHLMNYKVSRVSLPSYYFLIQVSQVNDSPISLRNSTPPKWSWCLSLLLAFWKTEAVLAWHWGFPPLFHWCFRKGWAKDLWTKGDLDHLILVNLCTNKNSNLFGHLFYITC